MKLCNIRINKSTFNNIKNLSYISIASDNDEVKENDIVTLSYIDKIKKFGTKIFIDSDGYEKLEVIEDDIEVKSNSIYKVKEIKSLYNNINLIELHEMEEVKR